MTLLTIKIKKKKMLKITHLFCAGHSTRTGGSFFEKVKNYQFFATNIFSNEKCDFYGSFGQKLEGLVP